MNCSDNDESTMSDASHSFQSTISIGKRSGSSVSGVKYCEQNVSRVLDLIGGRDEIDLRAITI